MLLSRLLILPIFHSTAGDKHLPSAKCKRRVFRMDQKSFLIAIEFKSMDAYISTRTNQAQTLIERTLLKQKNHFVDFCFIVMFFVCSSSVQMFLQVS